MSCIWGKQSSEYVYVHMSHIVVLIISLYAWLYCHPVFWSMSAFCAIVLSTPWHAHESLLYLCWQHPQCNLKECDLVYSCLDTHIVTLVTLPCTVTPRFWLLHLIAKSDEQYSSAFSVLTGIRLFSFTMYNIILESYWLFFLITRCHWSWRCARDNSRLWSETRHFCPNIPNHRNLIITRVHSQSAVMRQSLSKAFENERKSTFEDMR